MSDWNWLLDVAENCLLLRAFGQAGEQRADRHPGAFDHQFAAAQVVPPFKMFKIIHAHALNLSTGPPGRRHPCARTIVIVRSPLWLEMRMGANHPLSTLAERAG